MALYKAIEACRACGSDQLTQALDLGLFMLSDFRANPEDEGDKAPLVLLRCDDCTLVQLQHTVQRERLYSNYWYKSSTQPAMVAALQDIVRDATSHVSLQRGDVVVDVGANDGTLLGFYPEGVNRLAYEPALNLWGDLIESGAMVVGGFFPPHGDPTHNKAKVVTSIACFYDVEDPGAFVEGVKACLADDGVWINQMAYLPETLRQNNFGDIVHEHLTYWSVSAFDMLLEQHGLEIRNVQFNDVNGGSVRFVVGRGEHRTQVVDPVTLLMLRRFEQRIRLNRSAVRSFLHEAKRDGHKVIGYAAATKFNSALQYWGIGPELLEFIADRNPAKWGKYTPTGQQVISEEDMRPKRPAYLLCGAHHFIEAFAEREIDLLAVGTEFVIAFPVLQIVGNATVIGGANSAGGKSSNFEAASRTKQAS